MNSAVSGFTIESDSPLIMGILNVTPDSFSEQGQNADPQRAVEAARQMMAQGADIIDVGGESTRPGAEPLSSEQEIARIEPVLRVLQSENIPVSVDTRHAKTMEMALFCGTVMINDITALQGDPDSLETLADKNVYICLMHMQGRPQTMQDSPYYEDVVSEVYDFLAERIAVCKKAGIAQEKLIVDPGIGFGKTLEHNLTLLSHLSRFKDLGVPLLLGASRKSFIEKICGPTPPDLRLPGSLAACLKGYECGAEIFRVHDVAQTVQAFKVWKAMTSS